MGCTTSRDLTPPRTPFEVFAYEEAMCDQLQNLQRKEEKQLEKLRKKLERKRKKQLKKSRKNARLSDAGSRRRSTNSMRSNKNENLKFKDLDAEIEEETHALINTDLCMFLLNQITFSTEFFGNFERETTSMLAEFLNKENEFNKNLKDQSILMANPLDAAVQKWINFKKLHGAEKDQAQALQNPVIYVVFENIDISRPDDSNYDSIPPLCNVIMETKSYRTTPCKEALVQVLREIQWKGYVRLRLPENPQAKQEEIQKLKSKTTNQKGIYGMVSSGYGTDQDYDYAYITKLNTQKPLNELKMATSEGIELTQNKVLPDSCISYLGDYLHSELMEDSDDDMREFNEESSNKLDVDVEKRVQTFRNMEALQAIRRYKLEMERRRKLLQQRYINSQSFMSYFAELMRCDLAKHLAIDAEDLATATYRGASIFTRDYEIIPAIHVAQNAQHWPECTAKFRQRKRPIRKHPRSGDEVQWPTRAMIKQIETFGYHVIPSGYAPKRRKNPFRELEWRIVFPKAERYLERHLSYTQVKIFMIMKALIKTFIEPKEPGKKLMFVLELLRMHLFWECERNFTIWPEEFLGDVLLRFIETFKLSLKQKRLRDYFIQERNLVDGIPEHLMMSLLSTLSDISSNPLMHVLVAFRHLDYNEKFFPKLDFKRIFTNLSANSLQELQELSKNSNFFAECESEQSFEVLDADPDVLIGNSQLEQKTPEKFSKRACQLLYEIEKAKTAKKRRRGSSESIPVEFFFSNNLPERSNYESVNVGLEFLRRSNLLEILLDYFLSVLRKSIKFRNLKVARFWLQQLQRFVKYYRSFGADLLANDYENSIQLAEDALQELHSIYGTVEFETNDEVPEIEEVATNCTRQASKEVNPYEEVITMSENLPTIQKAMKMWETKLQAKSHGSQSSLRSTVGSMGSKKLQSIKAEVHKNNNEENKKKQRIRLRKKKAIKENLVQVKQKIGRDEYNETEIEVGSEIDDKNETQSIYSSMDSKFDSASEDASKSQKRQRKIKLTARKAKGDVKVAKSLNKAKPRHLESVSKTGQIALKTKKYTKTKQKRKPKNNSTTAMKSKAIADFSSDSDDFFNFKTKQHQKNLKIQSKGIQQKSNLAAAYDNAAYSTDGTDHLHESINVNLKFENLNTKVAAVNKSGNSASSTIKTITDNSFSDQEIPQVFEQNDIFNDDLFSENSPCSSRISKTSRKENRRICYESDTSGTSDQSFKKNQNQKVKTNFEFKCLEDLSFLNLKELSVSANEECSTNQSKSFNLKDIFDFKVVNEKNLSKCTQKSFGDFEDKNDIELKEMGIAKTKETQVSNNELEKKSAKEEANEEKSKPFYSKYINRENVLENFSIISPDMIDTFNESRQKVKNILNQEKLAHVSEVLKKRTLELKKAALK